MHKEKDTLNYMQGASEYRMFRISEGATPCANNTNIGLQAMTGFFFMDKNGIHFNGELIAEPIKYPTPDFTASRIYWDEETQSVKQEIVPFDRMYKPVTSEQEGK